MQALVAKHAALLDQIQKLQLAHNDNLATQRSEFDARILTLEGNIQLLQDQIGAKSSELAASDARAASHEYISKPAMMQACACVAH